MGYLKNLDLRLKELLLISGFIITETMENSLNQIYIKAIYIKLKFQSNVKYFKKTGFKFHYIISKIHCQ